MKTIKLTRYEIEELTIDDVCNGVVRVEDVLKLIDEIKYGSLTNVAGFKEELKTRITGK